MGQHVPTTRDHVQHGGCVLVWRADAWELTDVATLDALDIWVRLPEPPSPALLRVQAKLQKKR